MKFSIIYKEIERFVIEASDEEKAHIEANDRLCEEEQFEIDQIEVKPYKPAQFPALGHDALCVGYTELARAESADGN